jgi:uncharacterized protein (DUF1697 family)
MRHRVKQASVMGRHVALLRGINVGGHRKVPMAELREMAEQMGLAEVRTYVASGNLVFDSSEDGSALEARLEAAIGERFGFPVDVVLRSAAQWRAHVRANPLTEEGNRHPNQVMMVIGKQAPTQAEVDARAKRASANERVILSGKGIWIWFGEGAGRSKLGSITLKGIWTSRNWRTVLQLEEMAKE